MTIKTKLNLKGAMTHIEDLETHIADRNALIDLLHEGANEAKKRIEALEDRLPAQNALIDLMVEEADEANQRIVDLEYRNAGQNRLIDFMRKELADLKREVDYNERKASRYSAAPNHSDQHNKDKQGKGRPVRIRNLKERDEYLKKKYTPRFNELVTKYREEYPNNKRAAYSDPRKALKKEIYGIELLKSGKEVFAGYSKAKQMKFVKAMDKAVKTKVLEQNTGDDHQQYSREVMSEREQKIKEDVTRDRYRDIGEATMIGEGKARKLFPTPK